MRYSRVRPWVGPTQGVGWQRPTCRMVQRTARPKERRVCIVRTRPSFFLAVGNLVMTQSPCCGDTRNGRTNVWIR